MSEKNGRRRVGKRGGGGESGVWVGERDEGGGNEGGMG